MDKGFTVYTNDRDLSRVRLRVTGRVKAYVTIDPQYVRFIGRVGQHLRQIVKITPAEGYPIRIKEVKVQQSQNLHCELRPLGPAPSKSGYELVVENARQVVGSYEDVITILTDSKEKPSIAIHVNGNIDGPAGPPDPQKMN